MTGVDDLFDLAQFPFPELFADIVHPWEPLQRLGDFFADFPFQALRKVDGAYIGDQVALDPTTSVEPGAMIVGPAIIGPHCQIRHNAYIRQQVIVGPGSVVGNATEIKNSILIGCCEVAHFNYIGDSIIGYRGHLGAGAVLSNLKNTTGTVHVIHNGTTIDSGMHKLGSLIGDGANIGCNATLNPGSIIGRRSVVYPCASWRGELRQDHIAKTRVTQEVVPMVRS